MADMPASILFDLDGTLTDPFTGITNSLQHALATMGIEPPPEISFDSAQLSPMARSFYGENKRVSNAAIRRAGFCFLYPDYRAAFDAMWSSGDWAGEGQRDARTPMRRS